MDEADVATLTDTLIELGTGSGLAAVGVTGVGVFGEARQALTERKRRGLAADMQFTYRNPERSTDATRILADARAVMVGALAYGAAEPGPVPSGSDRSPDAPARPVGRVARYARHDHYARLRRALGILAGRLESLGWQARVVCDDNALVDRAAAHRAGLGWYGKNSLFFVEGTGSWSVLGSVVTDAPLRPTDLPPRPHGSGCGGCTRCRTACPTGALSEAGVVDARRCLAWLVQAPGTFPEEYRHALGDRLYGCDECQQVCPVNRQADRAPALPTGPPTDDGAVDLLELLAAPDEELLSRYGRWYIAGRDPRHLRRTALVVLGNVGDGRDPSTEAALRFWLASGDPLLAEHARWAAGALGRTDLVGPDG